MARTIRSLAVLGALFGAGLVACEDGDLTGAAGDARVRVLLTDAPIDYVEAAYVDIGEVYLLGGESEPQILLASDATDGLVNLLDLQNAATETLADAEVESGVYHQLRLIVEEARVVLKDGYQFADGSTEMDLKVPSGAQTGIKLNLTGAAGEDEDGDEDGGLLFTPGEMVLVLDFDVSRSFVIQGDPNSPAGIKSMSFKPTIRVVARDVASSISGTVTAGAEGAPIAGLTVTAQPVDDPAVEEEFQTQAGTAITDSTGAYTLHFLAPGTYTVTVTAPEGYAVDPATRTVTIGEDEDVASVDFQVVAGNAT